MVSETVLTSDLGIATNSSDLLKDAIDSFKNESRYILNPGNKPETNIYLHVNQDWGNKYWATGNGWMTYGLMRVVSATQPAVQYCADLIDRIHPRYRQTGRVQNGVGHPFGRDRQSL